ncbi:phospholipase D-like domain-containing protein [Myxococcota bacterium]|nr:phospholipase D-like domain-containing protein [Myxococcota bacterium]
MPEASGAPSQRTTRRGQAPPCVDSASRYLLVPPLPIPGNRVGVLEDGEGAYPAMLDAIAAAREWVVLETYIYRSDRTGWAFAEVLRERARAGVRARLLIDGVGSFSVDPALLEACRRDGVEVRIYHPLAPWRLRWAWLRRDHRKILVVDGRVGFAGSLNVDDCHLPVDAGGSGWHDVALRVDGPAAQGLARLFEQGWHKASRWREKIRGRLKRGGRPRDLPPPRAPDGPGFHAEGVAVQVVGHQPLRDLYRVRQCYLRAIQRASERVRLIQSYFLPDRALRGALKRAARAGVRVELMLPARSDVWLVDMASRYLFGDLLEAGVRIWLWEGGVLHAKAVVVDGTWCAVGSYNLDAMSMAFNLEVNLHAADPRLGVQVDAFFDRALARCRPLERGDWARRPRHLRLLEWAAYQFRRWL